MKKRFQVSILCVGWLMLTALALGQKPTGTMAFTVSMEQPSTHLYHVVFHCDGLKGTTQDFKMPVWTPGYYGIMNFARNVQSFRAEDGTGKELKWEKAAANDWKVQTGNAAGVTLSYDVLATSSFAANPYLGEDRGCIIGTGVFLYLAGQVSHAATVEIKLNPNWKVIATGLDPVSPDKPRIFAAPNFDVLYDSPILMGNLESLPPFEIKGISHYFIGYKLGDNFNREQFMKDLKAVIEQGIAVIGDIPYSHYTFLGIGPGQGGIEHQNSTTVPFTGSPALDTRAGRNRELGFLAHEYFHNYNVKRIRPIALGPFDYDKENLTNMLWVSEGFTNYYEFLMLARAGITNQEELLDSFRRSIVSYENNPGHLFQSATQSSHDTWSQGPFGGRGGSGIKKTISYYDKGAVLGMLLDFKIRHETKNKKSLDTVMRTLYEQYYRQKKRGWTDEEFRAVCEKIAGVPLAENFEYASTTKDIDYSKYLAYAGLELEPPKELPESDLGAIAEDKDARLIISAVEGGAPAKRAGLAAQDEIKALDGNRVDAKALNDTIAAKKPGDKVRLTVSRTNKDREVEVVLRHKLERSFKIRLIANPDPLQAAILKGWMTGK